MGAGVGDRGTYEPISPGGCFQHSLESAGPRPQGNPNTPLTSSARGLSPVGWYARVMKSSRLPWIAVLTLATACVNVVTERGEEPAERVLRVALCQLSVSGDYAGNMQAVDRALGLAASDGADLACFPEACLFGWVNPDAHQLADSIPGPTSDRLGELARRHGLMVAIGVAEREGGRLYDSALLIDRDGGILLRHRKVNILSELMEPPYTPGSDASASVVDTRLGRIGMLICADTFQDVTVGEIAAAGPQVVLVPYGWAAPLQDWPQHGANLHSWVAHTARRVQAPVVGVDAIGEIEHGPWTGYLYGGQSVVCDRTGEVILVLADREPEVRVIEIALEAPSAATARVP